MNKLRKLKKKLAVGMDRYAASGQNRSHLFIIDKHDQDKPVMELTYLENKRIQVVNTVQRLNEDFQRYNEELLEYFIE